jgi:uncharacterized membrane protein YqjE
MKRDLMRGGLAVSLLAAFTLALFALFRWEVPDANRDLVNFMLGQLSIMATGAIGFYFYTSKSSQDKNEVIERMGQQDNTLDLTGAEQQQ